MQEVDYLLEGFLRLILTGYILEGDAGLFLHIHLGITLADPHHAAALGHLFHKEIKQDDKKDDGQDDRDKDLEKERADSVRHLCPESDSVLFQALRQCIVAHHACVVIRVFLSPASSRLLLDLADNAVCSGILLCRIPVRRIRCVFCCICGISCCISCVL